MLYTQTSLRHTLGKIRSKCIFDRMCIFKMTYIFQIVYTCNTLNWVQLFDRFFCWTVLTRLVEPGLIPFVAITHFANLAATRNHIGRDMSRLKQILLKRTSKVLSWCEKTRHGWCHFSFLEYNAMQWKVWNLWVYCLSFCKQIRRFEHKFNIRYLEMSFQEPSKLLVRFLVQMLRILSFLLPGPGLLYHENAVSHPLTQSFDEMSSPGHHASADMCCCCVWTCRELSVLWLRSHKNPSCSLWPI